MRIHLPLHASHFDTPSSALSAGPSKLINASASPLITLGGDLVLVELQGELSWEGERDDGVIGVIGVDRPDKPTLHLGPHHLLHGKMANLPKPYAVIRRVVGNPSQSNVMALDGTKTIDGDAEEEESDEDQGGSSSSSSSSSSDEEAKGDSGGVGERKRRKRKTTKEADEEEEDEDGPLFDPNPDIFPLTPQKQKLGRSKNQYPVTKTPEAEAMMPTPVSSSSSPFYPPSTPMDYSSDLDMSSPAPFAFPSGASQDEDEDEDEEGDDQGQGAGQRTAKRAKLESAKDVKRKKKKELRAKRGDKERTRHYEVVGVVRKKVVFALRPEPLVAPTILPE